MFANGCRAPPWRQVHGDIAYILVTTKEGARLSITAATCGYFENKGKTDENEIDYERSSLVFPTLMALLKAKSEHFASTIDKKVRQMWFFYSQREDIKTEKKMIFSSYH